MADLIVIFWRDIPSQVVVRGETAAKRALSDRFQLAIDAAAMRAGASSADAYLEDWRRAEPKHCGEDVEAIVAAAALKLEADYDDARLAALVARGGRDA